LGDEGGFYLIKSNWKIKWIDICINIDKQPTIVLGISTESDNFPTNHFQKQELLNDDK
jgi:hypothetical protein